MRPENLKAPFKWDERKVLFQDRILYVPEYYDKYQEYAFPGWEDSQIFGNSNPLHIEYCSGNGTWIAEKAKINPTVNYVAIEKKFPRIRKIWSKVQNNGLPNLIGICGEGMKVTLHYFPHASVDAIFINFPDPWPKKRHAKHRIIQAPFVAELSRIMKKGALLTLVTDDEDYSSWMIAVMGGNTSFRSIYPAPFYKEELENYGTSFFDELWREKGKRIRYHQFERL